MVFCQNYYYYQHLVDFGGKGDSVPSFKSELVFLTEIGKIAVEYCLIFR
jgi:hypothetical protein